MTTQDLVAQAMQLKASERLAIIDALTASLDQPDPEIERVWGEEALRRAQAFDAGNLPTVSLDEVLP
jgi:Putative addiction module component